MRRRQRGGPEERLVGLRFRTSDDVYGLVLLVSGRGLEPKKVEREVHRWNPTGYRRSSARIGNRLNEIAPLPTALRRLNVGTLASNPVKRRHRLPSFSQIPPCSAQLIAAAHSHFPSNNHTP